MKNWVYSKIEKCVYNIDYFFSFYVKEKNSKFIICGHTKDNENGLDLEIEFFGPYEQEWFAIDDMQRIFNKN